MSTTLIPPLTLTAEPYDEQAVTQVAERLLNLPYGFAGQNGLIVRLKHVDSVQFYGSGSDSGFSFRRSQSVLPGGLSLKLRNKGAFRWASGTIHFKKPLNVTKYNSVVMWVKSTHPGLRFWVGMQDPHWTVVDEAQGRTDILPFRGFPPDQVVQLVVPYAAIYSRDPIDYSRLSQLAFEFGEDTVGNLQSGEIDIIGIAFVHQQKHLRKVRLVTEDAYVMAPTAGQVPPETPTTDTEEAQPTPEAAAAPANAPLVYAPEPIAHAEPAHQSEHTAGLLMKITDGTTVTFFRQLERLFNGPEAAETTAELAPNAAKAPAKTAGAFPFGWPAIAAGICASVVFVGAIYILTMRRRFPRMRRLPKVFHAVHWPFTVTEASNQARFQKDFWKGLASENVTVGWLSATGVAVDKTTDDEFYGAEFLEKQVELAAESGVRVLPSLSFARTVFHYESFLANPKVYNVRPVPSADRQLSDEEIRAKEKKGFPVWVPSFWQNKHQMPFRVIVEHGKIAGLPAATKSLVYYNLTAPELKDMAIRTIERMAAVAPGVRIEDAAPLLSANLFKPARGKKEKDAVAAAAASAAANGTIAMPVNGHVANGSANGHAATPHENEFWRDVIGAVKKNNPDFLFIAAGGGDSDELHRVGFDYVESDEILDAVVDHVKDGNAAPVAELLTERAATLPNSIFDVTKLVSPAVATETEQKQNLLATMLLALLPGALQHDENLPEEIAGFVQRSSRSTVLRKGQFVVLQTSSPHVLAFARWRRRALFMVVANFSAAAQEAAVRIDPVSEGLDDNKLYLFNNALHGAPLIQAMVSSGSAGPALALWGQNLRDAGLNVKMPGLSLKLFSVNLTRPIPSAVVKDDILTTTAN